MPENNLEEFKFPDEKDSNEEQPSVEFEIEIEDDTPPEDRGREPMPKSLVEELEQDELENYDENVKQKLKQMRKVWHDERREKEQASREQQEALALAQKLFEENKRFKNIIETGSKEYADTLQNAASLQLEMAKQKYKEAYDSGDSDQVMEASQGLQAANIRLMQAQQFKPPSLQEENFVVQNQQATQVSRPSNPLLNAWLQKNTWYGSDDEMTATALGIHKKVERSGDVAVGSEKYFAILDKTMRRRYPEQFDTEDTETKARPETRSKPSTVVAPAVRSTASNKIKLKASQVNLARRLGLTPEQYALELRRLESQNG
jgi:hypothetical protein